jgi:hypothetical protein
MSDDACKPVTGKKEREQAKIRARRDQRVTYDLPAALRQRMKELAEEQRLPASQLVTLALLRFLKEYEQGAVNLSRYKQPSRSPRYDWNLSLPADLTSVLRKKNQDKKGSKG